MMGRIVYVHGQQITMCNEAKLWRNFGVIELLVIIAIGLVGWNLKETIDLKEELAKQSATTLTHTIRIEYLEKQANAGERFTKKDGQLIKQDVLHIQEMFIAHIKRTEPMLFEIYNFMTRNEAKEP